MKNLLTLLLLVISLLASGQSDSQSLEVEIQYWKSIAESNDTVAYREYLNRYGENGLYYDEAITRITLLKTSGKQAQSKSIECCFYYIDSHYSILRFDSIQRKVWIKREDYSNQIRSNLALSRDFYENQATIALSRGTPAYEQAIENDKRALSDAKYAKDLTNSRKKSERQKGEEMLKKAEQAKSPDDYKNAWTADEEYQYDPMKSTSARDVYFKQDTLYQITETIYKSGHYDHSSTYYIYIDSYNPHYYKNDNRVYNGVSYSYSYYIKSMHGIRYFAFSKDKSSIIMWFEEDYNLNGVIYNKKETERIPKEFFLPKAVNYDFLNE